MGIERGTEDVGNKNNYPWKVDQWLMMTKNQSDYQLCQQKKRGNGGIEVKNPGRADPNGSSGNTVSMLKCQNVSLCVCVCVAAIVPVCLPASVSEGWYLQRTSSCNVSGMTRKQTRLVR